jgi:hypothetical protein
MDVDQKRKRMFLIICICFGIPIIAIIGILDYIEGDQLELGIDFIIGTILIVSPIVLKVYKADMYVYRISCLAIGLIFFWLVSIGAGKETVLYWLHIMPLLLFFFLEKKEGMFWTAVFIGLLFIFLFVPTAFNSYNYGFFKAIRFFLSILAVTFIGYGLESTRFRFSKMHEEKHTELLKEKEQLQNALSEIKTLSGLLPICSECKRIRDDKGYWKQIESYIRKHSDADFSHSICPECAKKLYPDLDL